MKKCENCSHRWAKKEFVGFIKPFDFRKMKVCRSCYLVLTEGNFKNWELTGSFYLAGMNEKNNEISAANLELIRQALRDVFNELILMNKPSQYPPQ